MTQVVKIRREKLAECMTCPLCKKLLKDATTISLCLHTFCRKCIYQKLSDEEADCCPECNIDLGCIPVEKLRADHSLQDIRAKIFPFKREKPKAFEVVTPPISLPAKRKERSLSSLVVNTPRVLVQTGLTGKRTKPLGRKTTGLRGPTFPVAEPVKKEESYVEDSPSSSSPPQTLNKNAQSKRQSSPKPGPLNEQMPNKDSENGAQLWDGKADLWKPLNCLVEAANRTKPSKYNSQGVTPPKSEQNSAPDCEVSMPKTKSKGQGNKLQVQDDKNGNDSAFRPIKRKKLHGATKKQAALTAQVVLNAGRAKRYRRNCPIWFALVASEDQEGDAPLPQIPASYLRIKDVSLPVSSIQKYLVKKLDLENEAEVEIMCQGQPVIPTLQLHNLVDLWLRTATTSKRVRASVGTSAKDFVMVLSYSRRMQAP